MAGHATRAAGPWLRGLAGGAAASSSGGPGGAGGALAWETVSLAPATGGLHVEPGVVPAGRAQGARLVAFVHGLLGQGRNWRSLSARLLRRAGGGGAARAGGGWQAALVDQRCHGRSARPLRAGAHTLASAAADLRATFQGPFAGWTPEVVVGHSLGGKVVLEYLRQLQAAGEPAPAHVWVLDSFPGAARARDAGSSRGEGARGEIEGVLDVVSELDARHFGGDPGGELDALLTARGFSPAFVSWLKTNLEPDPESREGRKRWAFDVAGARDLFRSYRATDLLEAAAGAPQGTTVHVVRALNSNHWSEADVAALEEAAARSPRLKVHNLDNAGHWLHMDNPKGLTNLLAEESFS